SVRPKAEASVRPRDEASVRPRDEASVRPRDEASVRPRDEASVRPRDEASVRPRDEASVRPRDEASVRPRDEASVRPRDEASVRPKAEASVRPKAEASVRSRAESSVRPRAEPSVRSRSEPSVRPRAESGVRPRAESSVRSISDVVVIDTDISKLKTKIRNMEKEQQAYVFQTQEVIRKQWREMEYLQAHQAEMLSSLRVCENRSRRQRDTEAVQDLSTALEHTDDMDELLEAERRTLELLDKEILIAEQRLLDKQKAEDTKGSDWRLLAPLSQRTAEALDNDVDRAVGKYDAFLAQNRKLREELDSLRIKRIQFQQMHQKMQKELEDIRGDIRRVVSRSTRAHDARVEVQSMTKEMKEMDIEDVAHYDVEMKELETVMAKERHLQEFLTVKCHSRSGQEDHAVVEWETREEMSDEMMAALDDTFLKLHASTGEEDLDVLVKRFLKFEDQNSALFDCVSKQNRETKTLQEQITQVKHDIEHFDADTERKVREQDILQQDMQERQLAAEKKAQAYNTEATAVTKILDQVKTGTGRVVRRLERQRSVFKDLPSSSGVTTENLLDIMDLMDQKVSSLLTMKAFLNSKKPVKVGSKAEAKQDASAKSSTASAPEYSEKKRLLTQKEIRQKMIKELLKEEGLLEPSWGKAGRPGISLRSRRPFPEA
ncbi:hypothetical protein AAFF_G00395000, partial [Aldrovandia affinis]